MRPLCAILLLAASLVTLSCGSSQGESSQSKTRGGSGRGPAAVPVVVDQAKRMAVPLEIRAIGNVEPWSAVEVRSRVGGPILKVHFEEGAEVKAGQILFTIDPREFEQTVREMEAAVAAQKAALGQAEANYQRDVAQSATAKNQADRYSALAAKGIISRQENEQTGTTAVAAEKAVLASKAAIESARAALQGAEAKLADARLQLSYTTIRAPIGGRTGALAYKQGDLITANATPPLIVINQVVPIYVSFSIPEQDLASIRSYGAKTDLTVYATPQNETNRFEGKLHFLDNRVDPQSGTILLKARFGNRERQLWPGQFADVAVHLASPEETTVPVPAVRNAQSGNYVFIVKPDMTAEQRKVESPRSFGNVAVISKGLKPGETVIVEGQLRVRPNVKLQVTRAGNRPDQNRSPQNRSPQNMTASKSAGE